MNTLLEFDKCYRLPWSLADNAISWLEPTESCNLACEGCYHENDPHGHKSLQTISKELSMFKRMRKSDCMSIAGGDPLVHPEIVDVVRMVKSMGWKPIINTNGLALTNGLLKDLKKAGAFGFTFHIDTTQKRKDADSSTEGGLNHLRYKFATMLASEGGLVCSFNQTVSTDNLNQIQDVFSWALKHPDIVHVVVFILFRSPRYIENFDLYVNGMPVELDDTYSATSWGGEKPLKATDVVNKLREVDHFYEPSAYLNGTINPNSTKWLLTARVAGKNRHFGYVTPKYMEYVQLGHRILTNRWLSYASPQLIGCGRLSAFAFAPIDRGMRKVATQFFRKPWSVFEKAYLQTFTIIQPVDIMPNGEMDMCDGCPDMTIFKDKLYPSCRLGEIKKFNRHISAVPRSTTK